MFSFDFYDYLRLLLFSIVFIIIAWGKAASAINSYKIMDYGWVCWKQWFEVVFLQTHTFSLHKTFIDGLELCGLLVDYCDVFISCLDSHSDGTHSLQRIHW